MPRPAVASRTLRGLAAVLLVLVAGVLPVLSAGSAQAAAGAPYDPSVPVAWQAAGSPTTLYQTQISSRGTVSFVPEGTGAGTYNSLVFNPRDGYLYATQSRAGTSYVIKIGQGGTLVDPSVATLPDSDPATPGHQLFFAGGINPATGVMSVLGTAAGASTMSSIDLATGQVSTRPLSRTIRGIADLTYARGVLWTVLPSGDLVSIDPVSGQVTTVRADVLPDATTGSSAALYGAGFTLGNGNIVFIDNLSGEVHQIDLSSGTYGDIVMGSATATSNNDAASSVGGPTDLVLAVCAQAQSPCLAPAGGRTPLTTYPIGQNPATGYTTGRLAAYAVTVHNDGPGLSTGSVVTDTLPVGTTYATSTGSRCTVSRSTLTCPVGRLAAGASLTFTVTVNVAAGVTDTLTDAATVLANETDPDPADNRDTHVLVPAQNAGISLVKTGRPRDADGDGRTDAGDTIAYTFAVTNTGSVSLASVTVSDPMLTRAGVSTSCPRSSLSPGQRMTCTSGDYVLLQTDVDRGTVTNTASAAGVPPGSSGLGQVTAQDTVVVRLARRPHLSLVTSASTTTDRNHDGQAGVGDRITYAFRVTNTGNVSLHAVRIHDHLVVPAGPAVVVSCPTAALAPRASMTCGSTPYLVTQADVDAGAVRSHATARALPPSGPSVVSRRSSVATGTPSGGLEVTRTASLRDRDRDGLADPGETIVYRFLVRNTGARTLRHVTVGDDQLTRIGVSVRCPSSTLAPGAAMTCLSTTYTVTQADVDAGRVPNVATSSGRTAVAASARQPWAEQLVRSPASASATPTDAAAARSALAYTGWATVPTLGAGAAALLLGALLSAAGRHGGRRDG